MPSPQGLPRMLVCVDCVHVDTSDTYEGRAKYGQYYCKKYHLLTEKKTRCSFKVSRTLIERREHEKPQAPTDTQVLIDKLKELMLCSAFDNVSGTITLHSAYSHMSDIILHLGPPPKRRQLYICAHCLEQVPLVADLVDIDKFYCDNCKRHTEPYYNDEV